MADIIKKICYPGYCIHEFAEKIADSDTAQLVITAVASFLGISLIFINMWPIRGIGWFLLACILSVVATGILTALSAFLFFIFAHFLIILFTPAYCLYTLCAEHEYKHRGDRAGQNVGSGAEADVGIRYFIEREKGRSPYHAEFLDV